MSLAESFLRVSPDKSGQASLFNKNEFVVRLPLR
jgi:hypothetical protein